MRLIKQRVEINISVSEARFSKAADVFFFKRFLNILIKCQSDALLESITALKENKQGQSFKNYSKDFRYNLYTWKVWHTIHIKSEKRLNMNGMSSVQSHLQVHRWCIVHKQPRIRKLSGPDVSCWTWDQGHHREHHFCFLPWFTSVDWEGWSTSHFHLRQARWFQFPHHKLSVPE